MRIGIDGRLWQETGVGRYISNLVHQLAEIDEKNDYVLFVTPELLHDKAFDFAQAKKNNWKIVETDIHWHTVEEQLLFHTVIENEYLDLVHFPYFSIPILYNRPFIITIHDLIINHFPTGKASKLPFPLYYVKRYGYNFVLKQAAKKAEKIITVSEATKKEIIDHLPVKENKIAVTYEGVDEQLYSSSERRESRSFKNSSRLRSNNKYFLYVGNAYPHKNLERLLEAFALVHRGSPQVKLVLAGNINYFYERLQKKVAAMGLKETVVFTGKVADAELSALYTRAEALLFPSLMEGFGLPGLEAMQAGTPVLASDIPVFREIYQDAATYFDPLASESIRNAMQLVLTDKKQLDKHIAKGQKLITAYSWEAMAHQTLAIYETATAK